MSVPWQTVHLGAHCKKIGSGATPRGGDQVYISEGTAQIRSQNIYNGMFAYPGLVFITEEAAERLDGVAVQDNDILLNITGDSVARCCQVPHSVLPARVNQHVAIIRPRPQAFDARFLMYYLISPYMQTMMLSFAGSGGTRKAITKEMIQSFEVPKPALSAQQAIASILSAYDDLIENNRRRMALLEESARLLYREWFVHLRFPGYARTRITDGVPKGWTKGSVGDFYDTASGGTPSRKHPDYFTGEIPWVKTQELPNGFITETQEYVTEAAINDSSAKVFPSRSVLVALYGATVGELGILAMPAATNQACCALFPRDPRAHHIHAFLFLRENKDRLVSLSAGAAQNNISQQIIRALAMVMPSPALARIFVETLSPMFNQWLNIHLQNQKLRSACDLLLPRLMSGEIAV